MFYGRLQYWLSTVCSIIYPSYVDMVLRVVLYVPSLQDISNIHLRTRYVQANWSKPSYSCRVSCNYDLAGGKLIKLPAAAASAGWVDDSYLRTYVLLCIRVHARATKRSDRCKEKNRIEAVVILELLPLQLLHVRPSVRHTPSFVSISRTYDI